MLCPSLELSETVLMRGTAYFYGDMEIILDLLSGAQLESFFISPGTSRYYFSVIVSSVKFCQGFRFTSFFATLH